MLPETTQPPSDLPWCQSSPEQFRTLTGTHLRRIASAGIGAIDKRLEELDRECPVERVLRWTTAGLVVIGFVLAVVVSPWWLALPTLAGLLMAQQHCRSCCLLSPFFCRYGMRSTVDIERERGALEILRGDFRALPVTCES